MQSNLPYTKKKMVTQTELFGSQAIELVKNVPVEKKIKKPVRHKATITLSYGNWGITDLERDIKNGERFISVSFDGHNEGQSGGHNTIEEALAQVEYLEKRYGEEYKIEIIDVENIRFNSLLNKWKDFIVNLCKERGQEIEKIWFDTSAPMDCEIGVRLANHKCWSSCISFRFEKGDLRACDSGFLGGTHFIGGFGQFAKKTDEETGKIITELLERCFNRECEKDYAGFYKLDENKPIEHREIKLDEKGWILK